MKRATITIPDELEAELDAFLAGGEPRPSITGVIQSALRAILMNANGKNVATVGRKSRFRFRLPIKVAVEKILAKITINISHPDAALNPCRHRPTLCSS